MTTEAIWDEFGAKLLGFIKSRVNNSDSAKDILQDVFVKIHKSADKISEIENLPSWVYQITRNAIIDYYRRKKIESGNDLIEDIMDEEFSEEKSFVGCMMTFVKELSPKYKDALEKTLLGGSSQKEYAVENELSYTAAKSRVQRAKVQLKELFSACCEVKSDAYGNIISAKNDDCNC